MSNFKPGVFLPTTLDERLLKLQERINQAWPTFGRTGDPKVKPLLLSDFAPGTCLRFVAEDGLTFHPKGVVRHGAVWAWSAERNDKPVFQRAERLQEFLVDNDLCWVEVL